MTRFKTYKLFDHPKTKAKKGRRPQTNKKMNVAKSFSRLLLTFKTKRFCTAFYESYPSMPYAQLGVKILKVVYKKMISPTRAYIILYMSGT